MNIVFMVTNTVQDMGSKLPIGLVVFAMAVFWFRGVAKQTTQMSYSIGVGSLALAFAVTAILFLDVS